MGERSTGRLRRLARAHPERRSLRSRFAILCVLFLPSTRCSTFHGHLSVDREDAVGDSRSTDGGRFYAQIIVFFFWRLGRHLKDY